MKRDPYSTGEADADAALVMFAELAGISAEERKMIALGRKETVRFLEEHGWPDDWSKVRRRALGSLETAQRRYGAESEQANVACVRLHSLIDAARQFHADECVPLAKKHAEAVQLWQLYCEHAKAHPARFKLTAAQAAKHVWKLGPVVS